MPDYDPQARPYGAILNLCERVAVRAEADSPPGFIIETSEQNRSMVKQVYDDCLRHGIGCPKHGAHAVARVLHALRQEVQHKINQGAYSLEMGGSKLLGAILIDPPTQMLVILSRALEGMGVCALVNFRDTKTGDAYMLARHAALVLKAFQNGRTMLEASQKDKTLAPPTCDRLSRPSRSRRRITYAQVVKFLE